jgi:acyl-CoA synthetase (AMP-forming)/AMP-acid ligase II
MRTHPAVFDALAVGAPDARWGQIVVAIVALRENASITLEALQAHCRGELAGYKVPRQMILVDAIKRSPAGKLDYRWAKAQLVS